MPFLTRLFLGILLLTACNKDRVVAVQGANTTNKEDHAFEIRMDSVRELADIPLGATISTTGLAQYNYHGEFIDGHILDFFYCKRPSFLIFNTRPDFVTLYFVDGVLKKKKYSFNNDPLFAILKEVKLKKNLSSIPDNLKEIVFRYKKKRIIYLRQSDFLVVEQLAY